MATISNAALPLPNDYTPPSSAFQAACPPDGSPAGGLPVRRWYLTWKEWSEAVFAAVLLVFSTPVIALAALLIKLSSAGPVLYSQVRLGEFGRPYLIYKLRTMMHRCEQTSGACWAKSNDPRATRVGRFFRRTHIDELPQLWNVLRGDMSLVGPRPERPEFVPALEQAIPNYRERLLVRPGVTGLAQVQLPADSDLESVRKKLILDRYYVHHVNWWLDVRLLLSTPLHLVGTSSEFTRCLFALPSLAEAEQELADKSAGIGADSTLELNV